MVEARTEEALGALMAGGELAGLQAALVLDGRIVYEGAWGRRRIDVAQPGLDLPVLPDSRFRVASMSKPTVALGIMRLAAAGSLALDADVSDYLGFRLRNPRFPDLPIRVESLLSHTSSLRDGEVYNIPLGHSVQECFVPGSEFWEEGAHFGREAPGHFFAYCNLGYGLLGTIIERLTGRRFDLWMRDEVLGPLGLSGSFNVNLLSDEAFARLGVLYRGDWARPDGGLGGPWLAQVDDYRGERPALACRAEEGLGPKDLEAYTPGSNGTLFGPQGGLRASAGELGRLLCLFLGEGSLGGQSFLAGPWMAKLRETQWLWAPDGSRGGEVDFPGECGRGLMAFGGGRAPKDLVDPEGSLRLWGHEGNAYGLRGAYLFDPLEGAGLAYIISGTKRDPVTQPGRFSFLSRHEEEVRSLLIQELRARGAWRRGGSSSRS